MVTAALIFLGLDSLYPLNLTRLDDYSRNLYNEDGVLLYAARSPRDDLWRLPVHLKELDPDFVRNLIKVEDKRFYLHPGVDPFSVVRSIMQLIFSGRIISGASTITMQTARLLERNPRTMKFKIIECFRALQLEYHFSKVQILEMYLTLTPYGGNIEGIKAASYAYFNHPPDYLSSAEAALLIALPKSPEAFRPDKHPNVATQVRNATLGIMGQTSDEPVPIARYPIPRFIPHMARRTIGTHFAKTFINLAMQQTIEGILDQGAQYNSAVLVVDHQSHKIVAYVGSDDFLSQKKKGQVDFITSIRSPGSTLKPFIYGLAIDMGMVSQDSVVKDQVGQYTGYSPHNFDRSTVGYISIATALKASLNTPVVRILDQIGCRYFWEILEQSGMTVKLRCAPNLSIALGGFGTNLESLVMLYGALANEGVVHPIHLSEAVTIGREFSLLSSESAKSLREILKEKNPLFQKLNMSYKTGTSYGHRDAWAIGLNNRYTVGVWVGHADGSPMNGATGVSHAVPILRKVFAILPNPVRKVKSNPQTVSNKISFKKNLQQLHVDQHFNKKMKIIFPIDESIIEKSDISIPLEVENEKGNVTWFINNKLSKEHWCPIEAGFFQISAIDTDGQQSSITVYVR